MLPGDKAERGRALSEATRVDEEEDAGRGGEEEEEGGEDG